VKERNEGKKRKEGKRECLSEYIFNVRCENNCEK